MFKFDNKISIDGIAILLAMVAACVWIGTLSQRVTFLEDNVAKQQQSLDKLTSNQNETTRLLAIIATKVDRRDLGKEYQ
jgi:hypothetical protein